MTLPKNIQESFSKHAKAALERFPNTYGQCAGFCAYISEQISADGITNTVALGSLSARGKKVFQYRKPIPARPSKSMMWEGHAWLLFPGNIIGEPSLFRTAKAQSEISNIRQTLYKYGLLETGALLIGAGDALIEFELKYTQLNHLKGSSFRPLIDSLIALNPTPS